MGLADGSFETSESAAIQGLIPRSVDSQKTNRGTCLTHLSACDSQLDLSPRSTHQNTKLLNRAGQSTQSVVVGQSLQEVLYGTALVVSTKVLLKLCNNLALVRGAEGGGGQNGGELGVLFEDFGKSLEGLSGGFESGGLRGGCVLGGEKC